MGGRIRGLGTSDYWFSLVYGVIVCLVLDRGQFMLVHRFWFGLCWCCIVVSFFLRMSMISHFDALFPSISLL
jgi:hypothetical protein